MNILINCSNIKIGGGVQVSHSFISELSHFHDHYFVVVISSVLKNVVNMNSFGKNAIVFVYDIKSSPKFSIYSKNIFLDELVEKYRINCVFSVFGPTYWRPSVCHVGGFAKPHYVYTDSPFFKVISRFEWLKLKAKGFFHKLDFKKNTDVLITENPDVTLKVKEIFRKRVYTVTNIYNQVFDQPGVWQTLKLPYYSGKYLITISAEYPHKNLKVIPLVVEELLRRGIKTFKFVVTLPKGIFNTSDLINEYIEYIGKINIFQCPSLYQQSHYMFLPTLLECFSASYAEAMKTDNIILTSDLDFARGICANAAIYFDPLTPSDIVDKLVEIDNNIELQLQLIENGRKRLKQFDSAEERAQKYIDIIVNEANHTIL